MTDGGDTVVIASGNMDHVRGLARLMAERGIRAELVQPPGGCGSS